MIEFLIRRIDDDWFDFPFERYPEVLWPLGIPSKPIAGWGTQRIEVEGEEISFSDEDPGFQFGFETGQMTPVRAREILEAICQNIEIETGQRSRIVTL